MSDERSPDSRHTLPTDFDPADPATRYTLEMAQRVTPNARTFIPVITHVHMLGVDPADGELLWCVHASATEGGEQDGQQVLSLPKTFFVRKGGDPTNSEDYLPQEDAEHRVHALADLMAKAAWN